MIFSGSLNAEGFEGWLGFHPLPSLKEPSVFIMDNASIHRKGRIRELIEARRHAGLFLPPYSPDLNDIEHDFEENVFWQSKQYARPSKIDLRLKQ